MLECSPCGVLSFCAWFVSVYLCVCTRTCVCVYIRLQNLCFALKDKEGGPGSQSVPLQINSLIPGSVFSPKHPLSPVPALLLLYTLGLSLALCQSETYMGCCGFVWESDGSVAGGGVEMHPQFESIALVFKASLFR